MAKFRDPAAQTIAQIATDKPADDFQVPDRSIGDIIRHTNHLTAEQVESILKYQRDKGVRFGEAAIALGFASDADVLRALAQQFQYPYATDDVHTFSEELVVANKPFSFQAEAFRGIRSQLMMRVFSSAGPKPALAIISPDSGDGKTFFASNLAVALSQLGGCRTLLIDADMRGPRQHSVFGIEATQGLSGVLAGRSDGSVIQQVRELPSLFVMPVGTVPPNPLELVERPAFGLLMRECLIKFDFVVVDTPAARYGADASVIAARCGAALALARKGSSHLATLQELVLSLAESPAKLAGVIVNEY